MRLPPILLTISYLFCSSALANDAHRLGTAIQYHLDQDSAPGFSASYQWQFHESILFDTTYIDSNDITVYDNTDSQSGNYSQLLLGVNFLKQYNDNLYITAGSGIGYVLSSSNQALISEQKISPYVKLAANYAISNNFSVELGQLTHFNSDQLATNHAIFFSVNFRFGDKFSYAQAKVNNNTSVNNNAKDGNANANNSANIFTSSNTNSEQTTTTIASADITPPVQSPLSQSTDNAQAAIVLADKQPAKAHWYVQFGAYSTADNAKSALQLLSAKAPMAKLAILENKGLFCVVSAAQTSKLQASQHLDLLKASYKIKGFVSQISANDSKERNQ